MCWDLGGGVGGVEWGTSEQGRGVSAEVASAALGKEARTVHPGREGFPARLRKGRSRQT